MPTLLGVGVMCLLCRPAAGAAQAIADVGIGVDVVCEGFLRGWALGELDDPALLTFGARPIASPATPRGESGPALAAHSEALRARERGAFTVGPAWRGAGGPGRAGATEGSEESGYLYPGPQSPPGQGLAVRSSGELIVGPWVASADLTLGQARPSIQALSVGYGSGRYAVHAGALPLRAGPGCDDGLVLGGAGGPLWGVDVRQRGGLELPLLGRVAIGLQLGALPEAGPGNRRPVFHAMRIELRPNEGLVVGLSRAVIFGGSASDIPITPRTVGLMLLGVTDAAAKDSDFENQVASVDVRWRTRLAGRALRLDVEYAADDAGLAFLRVPGLRVDAEARLGPHRDSWTGLEITWLAGPTATYPPWYRHGALAWGWTDRGVALGAPLAGQGLSVATTWGLTVPGMAVELASGLVHRGGHNLLAPDLQGTNLLAALETRGWRGAWEWSLASTLTGASSPAWLWSGSLGRRF